MLTVFDGSSLEIATLLMVGVIFVLMVLGRLGR